MPTEQNILFVGESAGDLFGVPKVGAGDLPKTCSMGLVHVDKWLGVGFMVEVLSTCNVEPAGMCLVIPSL